MGEYEHMTCHTSIGISRSGIQGLSFQMNLVSCDRYLTWPAAQMTNLQSPLPSGRSAGSGTWTGCVVFPWFMCLTV